MKLESQVTSLELSKELKELGVKQDSLFYWESCPMKKELWVISSTEWHDSWTGEWGDCHLLERQENYSAFTPAELGELLPPSLDTKKDEPFNFYRLYITTCHIFINEKLQKIFVVNYKCDSAYAWEGTNCRDLGKNQYDPNLANAMAKMLIYLIENNLTEKQNG